MPKYKVCWNEWMSCTAVVEVENEDAAYDIVKNAIHARRNSEVDRRVIDWQLEDIEEVKEE